ncbi:MAG: hypothetical protein JXN65_02495 [Clostridia bacterium]|nr:hypothetical protein [Clostridia bacterium]
MKIVNKIKDNALRLMFLILLSVAESYYFLSTLFGINNVFLLICLATIAIVFLGVVISSLRRIFSISIFFLVAVAIFYLLIYFTESIKDIVFLVSIALLKSEHIKLDEIATLLVSVSFVFVFINYLIIMLFKKSIISMLLSIAMVSYLYFKFEDINILFAVFFVISVMLVFLSWIIPKADEEDDKGNRKSLVSFVMVVAAAVILAPIIVIRASNNIAPLAWIDDLHWIEGDTIESGSISKVIVRIDGQSQLTNLNHEFNYNTSKMMYVTSPYLEKLRSKTYDSYTKYGWEKSQDDTDKNKEVQYTMPELIEILNENNISYTPYEMTVELIAQSQMIFVPLHAELATEFESEISINPYDDIFTNVLLERGTTYSLNTLHINYMSEEFMDLILHSKSDNIDNRKSYVAIPEDIEKSLKPLAEELTKDAASNYEKAKIIESYLSHNYTYNLKPPEKPANVDFVEYFLFDTHEGFCTHYASSMVLLLRCIDIPSRYVTGYVLTAPDDFQDIPEIKAGDSMFIEGVPFEFSVKKRDSHAWVEVWFDDFGWLAFEPTTIYTSLFSSADFADSTELKEIEETEQTQQEEPEKSAKKLLMIFGFVLLPVVILIIFTLIYIENHRTNKEKVYAKWKSTKKLYQTGRRTKKINETVMEFARRVDGDNTDLLEAARIFELAAYSNRDITAEQVIEMDRLYKSIRKFGEIDQ